MPTSVIAEPVVTTVTQSVVENVSKVMVQPTPAVDTWMKFNPWFDWNVIFGIPFWVIVGAFLTLVFIVVNAYWFFRIKKLQPVRGYVDALKMATQEDVMTWIVSTTKNLTIECLKKRDTVLSFYDPTNITKWVHVARSAVLHVGGKGGVLASEDYYRTRDLVSEIALCSACDDFNQNQGKYSQELISSGMVDAKVIPPIQNYEDYESYGRRVLNIIHPDGLPARSYSIWDPDKAKKYFPPGLTATLKGGIIIRDARTLNLGNGKPSFWEKFLPFGIIIAVLGLGIVAAWFAPLG